jgi:HD-GYP domain-containing protein (c-di-GMP phosphodiesterase class II)
MKVSAQSGESGMSDGTSGTDPLEGWRQLLLSSEILDNLATGFVVFRQDGSIKDGSNVGLELLGVSGAQLQGLASGQPHWRAVRSDGSAWPFEQQPMFVALRDGVTAQDVLVGVDVPGRPRRWLSTSSYPASEAGGAAEVFCTLTDVTETVRREQSFRLMTEVNRVVMNSADEEQSLRQLCNVLVAENRYALAWIGVKSTVEEGAVDITCAAGRTDYPYSGMVSWSASEASGRGPVGTALRTGATQVVNNLPQDSLLESWRRRAWEFGLKSCVAIPFALGARDAVLAVYDEQVDAFDEMSTRNLEEVAKEAEFVIAHVRSMQQLEAALDGTLAAVAGMTEYRDPYTAGHQYRVGFLGASLSAAIAEEYGLDGKMVELIRQSGEVHDIGKIAIPTEILAKPARLTAHEYELVKTHAAIGYEILSNASLPWPIAEVAYQHHERMDGSGYPRALPGSQIILPARIVAVADVVEAMTQHRPYRPGLGVDLALGAVSAGAGTLFDARVVQACQAVFASGFTFATAPKFPLAG